MAETKVSMKLLIDTKTKRVLFAEAGKDCVDFLFNILSLPVATIIRLLQAQGMVGSLPNLYKSLENLNDTYIQPNQSKDIFLKPATSSSVPLLALTDAPSGKNFYTCNIHVTYVSNSSTAVCPLCRKSMTTSMSYVAPPAVQGAAEGVGIVKEVVTYMVMDDLVVKPMSTISSITLLNKFSVKDVGALEEKVVHLGMNEAIKMLKTSLQSKKVLTDVFC
ncbi:hypothetical protein C2S53_007388 [Perilla frutescens var. hirtella]|uniref:DUF674 domain-containing protein n=1 Tax=Perilla frutescens var. hirtella TaxID=608512 RepID=A0AAD4JMS8_PERFH|nr:hypothetical protein C2S53_007388 [Perilla frutescens var. hirtella]